MGRPSRYELITKIASGGMATVYVGVTRGPLGFSRIVAVKRAHPHLLEDPEFANMFRDEARLASRLRHPHVVAVLDVEHVEPSTTTEDAGELYLVMDYVEGAALSQIMKRAWDVGRPIPPPIAVRIVLDTCAGLDAAHRLTDDIGARLGIVHRDVSPHNLLVGVDGMTRVTDFGIARVTTHPSFTRTGLVKGKLEYLAPEYLARQGLDARSDLYSLGIVAWETLANRRMFRAENEIETMQLVAEAKIPPLALYAPEIAAAVGPILDKALAAQPGRRFDSAAAFASALEDKARASRLVASHAEVGAYVESLMGDLLATRRRTVRDKVREIEERGNALEATADLPSEPQAAQATLTETTVDLAGAPAGAPKASAAGSSPPVGLAGAGTTLPLPKPPPPETTVPLAKDAVRDALATTFDASDTARVLIPSTQPPEDLEGSRWKRPAVVVGGVVAFGAIIFGVAVLRPGDDPRPAASGNAEATRLEERGAPPQKSAVVPAASAAPVASASADVPRATPTAGAKPSAASVRTSRAQPVDLHAIPPSPYKK